MIVIGTSLLMFSVWDSSSKVQTGLLTGNVNSLGHFHECVNIPFNDTSGDFKGQYCLARFDLPNDTADAVLGPFYHQAIEEEEEIHVGVCELQYVISL